MAYSYAGRVIVITGGAGDIGMALAREIAPRGARVVLVDIRGERAERSAASLAVHPSAGGGHTGLGCDLTQRAQVEALIARIEREFGRIDVLVNNAGMTSSERFAERSVESIERELTVNLTAPLVLTRLAIPLLENSTDPRIISTVSLGGVFPLGETPIYTASKFGLRGAMLSIGLDLAQRGIRVGSVLPSATDTRMLRQEAIEAGNSLQFQDPPQPPARVARSMMSLLDRPRLEAYPRIGESRLLRAVMTMPNVLPRLLPMFRKRGDRGMARFMRELAARGDIVQTEAGWALAEGEAHPELGSPAPEARP
ncbi:SDR family oxidoreductase [Mycetocola tolaasinivorans]|uniref:SDR family oxidoreductase n=1 Tax=Mycetocola tolaasinivorans TaxID=76635 RepID=A0A3L7ADX7_9MICO|nr:SDR family oxidoreductase [Mycetocola tolaasinivorans]RLP78010.1 SDR family oxidoreductase [Mycetocola tolaasinivorans]